MLINTKFNYFLLGKIGLLKNALMKQCEKKIAVFSAQILISEWLVFLLNQGNEH